MPPPFPSPLCSHNLPPGPHLVALELVLNPACLCCTECSQGQREPPGEGHGKNGEEETEEGLMKERTLEAAELGKCETMREADSDEQTGEERRERTRRERARRGGEERRGEERRGEEWRG
eukprot:764430-Hanusia_phi.AAC.1